MHLVIRTLKAGWYDKDEVMLHAAFQLPVDFVEQEQPGKHIDWSYDNEHQQSWLRRSLFLPCHREGGLDRWRVARGAQLRAVRCRGTG